MPLASVLRLERLPLLTEPLLESLRAVAADARPRFGAVRVAAGAPRVGVPDGVEVEELFPVRTLFGERCRAEAGLHPLHAAVRQLARMRHVAQVLVACHGAVAKRSVLDRAAQRVALSRPKASRDEISHGASRSIFHDPPGVITYRRRSCRRLGL